MTAALVAVSKEQIIAPVLDEMVRRGIPYRGVLYVNLMITDTGPSVVEFNARFGDPEAQVVLPLMQEDLLDVRMVSTTHTVKMRTVTDVIEEFGVQRIDLLKLDVQKSEMQVLEGIEEAHWPRISQIAAEVHDTEGRLEEMSRSLLDRGFKVTTEQDPLYEGTEMHLLFATRSGDSP